MQSERIERLAEYLCSEFDFSLNPCVGYSWPEHENDDGYRGDGSFVKLQPSDVQAYARENAKRILAFLEREAALSAAEPVKVRNDDVGFVDFLNADRPYICRKTEGTCYLLIDRGTGDVVGYRKYDDEAIDTTAPSVAVKAIEAVWKYSLVIESSVRRGDGPDQYAGVTEALRLIKEARSALSAQVQDVAVAEIVSAHGDPEAFGERELVALIDIQKFPYRTKLYAAAPAVKQGEVE